MIDNAELGRKIARRKRRKSLVKKIKARRAAIRAQRSAPPGGGPRFYNAGPTPSPARREARGEAAPADDAPADEAPPAEEEAAPAPADDETPAPETDEADEAPADDTQGDVLGIQLKHLAKLSAKGLVNKVAKASKFTAENLDKGVTIVSAAQRGDVVALAKIATAKKAAKSSDPRTAAAGKMALDTMKASEVILKKSLEHVTDMEKSNRVMKGADASLYDRGLALIPVEFVRGQRTIAPTK